MRVAVNPQRVELATLQASAEPGKVHGCQNDSLAPRTDARQKIHAGSRRAAARPIFIVVTPKPESRYACTGQITEKKYRQLAIPGRAAR